MGTKKTADPASTDGSPATGNLSAEERGALKERTAELRAEARRGRGAARAAAEAQDVADKIAELPVPDRTLAERVHALITDAAPELAPKLWYGQPAYAKDGKVVCFFRSGHVDSTRYSVLGFEPAADLDDASGLWPTSYALAELTDSGEALIRDLVRRAVG